MFNRRLKEEIEELKEEIRFLERVKIENKNRLSFNDVYCIVKGDLVYKESSCFNGSFSVGDDKLFDLFDKVDAIKKGYTLIFKDEINEASQEEGLKKLLKQKGIKYV